MLAFLARTAATRPAAAYPGLAALIMVRTSTMMNASCHDYGTLASNPREHTANRRAARPIERANGLL
ncbi:MAG: hypothetical protein ACTHXA_14635 [Gulosibacter sp.]|uniref:hypothetical protein n=1 Tax=Gulosibacter sp. TaxID=2817531 RepID=UPI003F9335A5